MVDSAGITMTFTEKFYQQYQNSIVEHLTSYLNGVQVPDFSPEFSLGIPKVQISLKKQKVIYFKMQEQKNGGGAEIKIISKKDEKPYLQFTLKKVDMDFSLDYTLASKPEWIRDKGTGRITIRGLSISMKLEPYTTADGKLQVNFT